jgi:hypothetical protein
MPAAFVAASGLDERERELAAIPAGCFNSSATFSTGFARVIRRPETNNESFNPILGAAHDVRQLRAGGGADFIRDGRPRDPQRPAARCP